MNYAAFEKRAEPDEASMDETADAAAAINEEFDCHPREAASSCTELGADEDQSNSADGEVAIFLFGFIVVIAVIAFTAWCATGAYRGYF